MLPLFYSTRMHSSCWMRKSKYVLQIFLKSYLKNGASRVEHFSAQDSAIAQGMPKCIQVPHILGGGSFYGSYSVTRSSKLVLTSVLELFVSPLNRWGYGGNILGDCISLNRTCTTGQINILLCHVPVST